MLFPPLRHCAGYSSESFYDRSEFPWLRDLEAAAPDITLEMEALARAGGGAPYKGGSGEMSTVYDATQGWGTMRLRYMGRWVGGLSGGLVRRRLLEGGRPPFALDFLLAALLAASVPHVCLVFSTNALCPSCTPSEPCCLQAMVVAVAFPSCRRWFRWFQLFLRNQSPKE